MDYLRKNYVSMAIVTIDVKNLTGYSEGIRGKITMPTKPLIRIPVTLDPEDNQLLITLRSVLEAKSQKRHSVADIVRLALRELAKAQNVA